MNKFIGKLAGQVASQRKLPKRVEMLGTVLRHPKGFAKTLKAVDSQSVALNKARTGLGRWGQAKSAGKRALKTDTAKDLAVNTGGLVGSIAGGAAAGPLGALAGDNIGAVATRRVVNRRFAIARVKTRLGPTATRAEIAAKTKRTTKALERLDKRKGANLSDQVGWGVGNAVALATPGVNVPLRGGLVATRTVPQISRNAKAVIKGQKGVVQGVRDAASEIARDNNVKRIVRRGNARERLFRQKFDKFINQGRFSYADRARPRASQLTHFRRHRPPAGRRWRKQGSRRGLEAALG